MSYQQVRSAVTVLGSAIVLTVYLAIVLGRLGDLPPEAAGDTDTLLRFWGTAMLVFVPIAVVTGIVTMILFSIVYCMVTGEEPPQLEDERDKLIELKSNQVSQAVFVFVFVGSMVPIVMGMSVTVMFLSLLIGGFCAQLTGEIGRILMYR